MVTDDMTSMNSRELYRGGIIRKNFNEMVVEHWNRFPGGVFDFLTPVSVKEALDNALSNMFWLLVSPKGVRHWT